MEEILREQVVLDGKRVTATLDASGLLQWRGDRNGQLVVYNDLIGFGSLGCSIVLYTFKMTESTSFCGKGTPGRRRKDLVMEFTAHAAPELWRDAIQRALDASGALSLSEFWWLRTNSGLRMKELYHNSEF